jgi:hypothetical protein
LDEIIVEIKMKVILGDLIFHNDGIWDTIDDGCCLLFKELDIFGFIVTSVPGVSFTILTALDDEYNLLALH